METKENLYLQSNLAFIFDAFTEEAGWPKEVLDDLTLRETKIKIRPSWSGNKLDKIIRATDEVKQHYYFGSKVWEAWKEAKKYIINHLNPNWTDPTLLKSGYNISSLLHLIRESTFHHEAHDDAKDNVRCVKKRQKGLGNNNWKDIYNSAYNEKYNNKIEKLKKKVGIQIHGLLS
jgi:hypothetical protein